MKKLILLCMMSLFFIGTYAQEEVNDLSTRENMLSRTYLRPSLSTIYFVDGSSAAKKAVESIKTLEDRKFDINVLKQDQFNFSGFGEENRDSIAKVIIDKVIAEENIGQQIMKNWCAEFDATIGSYTTNVWEERGTFAATDNDVLAANASQRQSAMFELGEKLIDRSYLLCYFITDATYTNKKGEVTEGVNVLPFVYKLDFNEEVRSAFYDKFSSPSGIEQSEFPVIYVANAKKSVYTTLSSVDSDFYNEIMVGVKQVKDFMVQSPVAKRRPISAKIGTKEGLTVDKRFDIMERRLNKEGEEYDKRIACVRVKKVADNDTIATGETENYSTFYQFKGRGIQEGMTMVENPDLGMSVGGILTTSELGVLVEYRLGKNIGLPGFLVGLNAGLVLNDKFVPMLIDFQGSKHAVLKVGLNLAKEFNFARNFVFTPTISGGTIIGLGLKDATTGEQFVDSYYVEGSLKLGYMVAHNAQVFIDAGYSYSILGPTFKALLELEQYDKGWDKMRKPNAIRLGAGFKIYF